MRDFVTRAPEPIVSCVDLREGDVLPKPIAEGVLAMFAANNPKIGRSGFLMGARAVLGIQAERILRESGNQNRRTFREQPALEAWLGEALSDVEKTALNAFLSGKS